MHFTSSQRYARQISLPEIGKDGQEKLAQSSVLVVGAGGLGSPLLCYLAGAGVGRIGIIDPDRVALNNLHRQILYEETDIDRPKVQAARDVLLDRNGEIKIEIFEGRLGRLPSSSELHGDSGAIHKKELDSLRIGYANSGNDAIFHAPDLIKNYDIIADGCDDIETRFMVADTCAALHKTLVTAAIHRYEGQLSTFKPYLGEPHPGYRCLYPEAPPPDAMPSCSEAGILGPVAGVLGCWQAAEVIKELLGVGESLSGFLLRVDLKNAAVRKVRIPRTVPNTPPA